MGQIRSRKSKDRQYNDQRRKHKRTGNDLQNITQKTKDRAIQTQLQTGGSAKGKQFLLHMWHPSCYSCNPHYHL